MNAPRNTKVCPHCLSLVQTLRACGHTIGGVEATHYLMAGAMTAIEEGHTLEETIKVLALIWRDVSTVAAPTWFHTSAPAPGRDQDVSVVDAVPPNAIDAFVAAQGERLA